jgi:hypothetical protein
MTKSHAVAQAHHSTPLLRWMLRRDDATLVCALDANDDHSFEVSVTPQWLHVPPLHEHFDAPAAAFERHAEVAALLRESGWVVTGRDIARHDAAA